MQKPIYLRIVKIHGFHHMQFFYGNCQHTPIVMATKSDFHFEFKHFGPVQGHRCADSGDNTSE